MHSRNNKQTTVLSQLENASVLVSMFYSLSIFQSSTSLFFSILALPNRAESCTLSISVVLIYSTRLATGPTAPTTTNITFADVFHNLSISLARFLYFFTFLCFFSSVLLLPGTAISIFQVWSVSLFFLL